MQIGSLFTLRRAFVMGAVAILAVLVASLAPAQAKNVSPDGGIDSPVVREWFHSTVAPAESPAGSDRLTDGWLHSSPAVQDSTAYAVTDGWLHSSVMESLPKPDGAGPVVAESRPLTDGWLHSVIAERAGDAASRTPVASTSKGFPTEIAIASSIFALMLAASGAMFLKRRHTSIAA